MSRTWLGLSVTVIVSLAAAPAVAQSDPSAPLDVPNSVEVVNPVASTDQTELTLPATPASTEAVDKPFKRLFQNLFTDLRRLPSKDTAVVMSIGSVLGIAAHPLDDHITEHASAGGTDQVFAVGGALGGGYLQAGGAIVTYAIGKMTKQPTVTHIGADLIRAQVLAGVVTHSIKLAVRRDRPGGTPGHMPATYAFPSGHAAATWASATVLWRHLGWKVGVPASGTSRCTSPERACSKTSTT